MRIRITIDDELGASMKAFCKSRGQSLSAFFAEAGQAAMSEVIFTKESFDLITFEGGGTLYGINLDRTSDLLAAEGIDH